MAKASGNTRTMRPQSKSVNENRKDFQNELASGKYNVGQSYFSEKNGGQLLVSADRTHDPDEYAAAKAMADAGMIVKMTSEKDISVATRVKEGKDGNPVYLFSDGLVNGYTYEQQTKNPQSSNFENLKNAVDGALKHAKDKGARIPLIYDRYGRFHREHIEAGLAKFEDFSPDYRFKAILVVDQHGNVWEHQHNK